MRLLNFIKFLQHFFVIDELDKAKKQDYGTLLND